MTAGLHRDSCERLSTYMEKQYTAKARDTFGVVSSYTRRSATLASTHVKLWRDVDLQLDMQHGSHIWKLQFSSGCTTTNIQTLSRGRVGWP
jgi:hypothetical protein